MGALVLLLTLLATSSFSAAAPQLSIASQRGVAMQRILYYANEHALAASAPTPLSKLQQAQQLILAAHGSVVFGNSSLSVPAGLSNTAQRLLVYGPLSQVCDSPSASAVPTQPYACVPPPLRAQRHQCAGTTRC